MSNIQFKVVYSDIDRKWITDNQGNIKIDYNALAVANSVTNILSINKGEMVMNPSFGANLRGFLFNSLTEGISQAVAERIRTEVTKWDNRVNIQSISFNPASNNNQLGIQVNFTVKGSPTIFELSVVPSQ